jgi:hypothetical protein
MLNTRNKSGRGGHSYAHKLDLTENKKLCAFLKAYKPFVSTRRRLAFYVAVAN